jgi:hypothetical protein
MLAGKLRIQVFPIMNRALGESAPRGNTLMPRSGRSAIPVITVQ